MTLYTNEYNNEDVLFFHDIFHPLSANRPDFRLCQELFNKGDDILELACGNGIGAFQLSKHVNSYLATDLAPNMVKIAEENVPACSFPNVSFAVADMIGFKIDRCFDGIILTGNSFQEILTQEQQLACLNNIKSHLKKDGKLVIMIHPFNDLFLKDVGFVTEQKDANDSTVVYQEKYNIKIDLLNSLIRGRVCYAKIANGVVTCTAEADRNISIITEREFNLLLKFTGFQLITKRRFSENTHSTIFACQRDE